jgi:hypothetical protein
MVRRERFVSQSLCVLLTQKVPAFKLLCFMNNWIIGIPVTRLQTLEIIIQNPVALPDIHSSGVRL